MAYTATKIAEEPASEPRFRTDPTNRAGRAAVSSPVTRGPVSQVGSIATKRIEAAYERELALDVRRFLGAHDALDIYACEETGYRFFHPAPQGDSAFYAELQRHDWFYKADKWEYREALTLLPHRARVLDIGCGAGGFLALATEAGCEATGLELNETSAAQARHAGLDVRSELAGDHAAAHPERYDVVASFQVLEHVEDVASFLSACHALLVPGGLLIIGVPDNAGFLRFATDAPLNMPPHHVGLWDGPSLEAATSRFGFTKRTLRHEPLAEPAWYAAVMEDTYLGGGWRRKLYHKLGFDRIFARYVAENAHAITGHTVLGAFERRR